MKKMARERMVTRTVELSLCETMCMDTTTAEVQIHTFEIGGGLTDEKALLKVIKKLYETDTFKCVAISKITPKEILYGMPENEFIKLATILPPRGAKGAEG